MIMPFDPGGQIARHLWVARPYVWLLGSLKSRMRRRGIARSLVEDHSGSYS
jgi:hypothetical protein